MYRKAERKLYLQKPSRRNAVKINNSRRQHNLESKFVLLEICTLHFNEIFLIFVNITGSPFSDYYAAEDNTDHQNNGDLFLPSEYPYAEDIKIDLTGKKMKKERHKKMKSHMPKVYNCNICGEDFDGKQSLSTHRKEHGTESMCQVYLIKKLNSLTSDIFF